MALIDLDLISEICTIPRHTSALQITDQTNHHHIEKLSLRLHTATGPAIRCVARTLLLCAVATGPGRMASMANRFLFCVAAAGLLLLVTGCAVVDTGKAGLWGARKLFRPRPTDYRDTTQEEDDPWAFVRKDGRGHRPLENENDPLKKYMMSPKARNIERNLGIE